jgi:TPP-dependent pyruvate/acetoin dehydrogenase alpha subunit
MPGKTVDGMDVEAVCGTVREAVARGRSGEGPTLIECLTYRFLGHSKSDQRVYRSKDEEAAWRERDPIVRLRNLMCERGLCEEAELEGIVAKAASVVDAAVEFAEKSSFPEAHTLAEGLFAESDEPCPS